MKDIEHPEFIIKVMIFNEYISDVCENTRLHPSGPPSSSLTDSWPAHIKAAKIPRITSCHIIWQLFGGNASWPWCPLCFLGKDRILRNLRAFNGVKNRGKDRQEIYNLPAGFSFWHSQGRTNGKETSRYWMFMCRWSFANNPGSNV